MNTSLRDSLTTVADNPAPPSTVDIDAALSTGRRRRSRRITALAGAGTFTVAAVTVVVGAALLSAPTPTKPAVGTAPPPTSQFPEPPTDYTECGTPDLGFVDKARTVLQPPARTWSTPWLGKPPPDCTPPPYRPLRGFTVYVADQQAVGTLHVSFVEFPGLTFAECDPKLQDRCQTLPEGNLRPYTGSRRPDEKLGLEHGDLYAEAVLDTPTGYFRVGFSTCALGKVEATPPPCLAALLYTDQQLGELAVALARTL